jgi:putative spermidine/putrescine transport system substrate-binding protein
MRIRTFLLVIGLMAMFAFGACVAPVAPAADGEATPVTEEEAAVDSGETTELVVSTWGYNQDLIDKNLTVPFEEANNVKIVYETGNNSERLTKLIARKDNPNVDVVHFAGAFTERAQQEGVLQAVDPSLLSNYDELYDWAKDPIGEDSGIGYAISGYLLAYRTDKLDEAPTSWADLLDEDLKGYVTVPDLATTNGPATIVMLAEALGGDIDNTEPGLGSAAPACRPACDDLSQQLRVDNPCPAGRGLAGPFSSFAIGNLLETGLPIETAFPVEGIPAAPSVVSIVAGSEKSRSGPQVYRLPDLQ